MKRKNYYQCEICQTVYDSEELCRECEERHIKPKKINNWKYKSRFQIPTTIDIEFEDGRTFEYRLGESRLFND